jgi:hypothetical protein
MYVAKKARVFARGKPIQPTLKFVGKAGSLPWRQALESNSAWVSSSVTLEHKKPTRLALWKTLYLVVWMARDKHSSLFVHRVRNKEKCFIRLQTGAQSYKTFLQP